jgi:hypothetical protein
LGRCVEPAFVGYARNDASSFAQTIDLLGDGSIRLVSTPVHTTGQVAARSQILLREGRFALKVRLRG